MKVRTEEIDRLNETAYAARYAEKSPTLKIGYTNLERSFKAGYEKGMAYARLNIAVASFLESKNKEAIEAITQAQFYFSENPHEPGYARALSLQGNIYESFGDYEKGLELCLKSVKLAVTNNDRETEAETSAVLGLIYTRLCNLSKALDYYHHSLDVREALGDESGMASSLNRIAMIHRMSGEFEEALRYYFSSLEIRKRNKLESAVPWTMLGIASTYEEMGDDENALKYYKSGKKGKDSRLLLQCMTGIGRVLSRKGERDEAEKELIESLKKAEELNALPLIPEVWSALARHYELNKQNTKALSAYKKFQSAREKVLNEDARNRVRNLEIASAIEKSEIEKEIYRLRHVELKAAFDQIEEKNREITDSITYARRIQQAILPEISEIPFLASRCFIIYIPKDIVSGDFYWFSESGNKIVIVAADCTGHGVPGSMMSMLGVSLLEEIVNRREILNAGEILDTLRLEVMHNLHQTGKDEEAHDGMDISLCIWDRAGKTIQFAGAYNNLCLIRKNEIVEYKADRMPIGIFENTDNNFTSQDIPVISGDMVYIGSDGFEDQFGGPEGKKFKRKALLQLFSEVSEMPLQNQKELIANSLSKWKGELQQVDDILIMGFRI
jgi:serine phosphatase RsbU (regulator of sigma subunit)